MLLLMRTACLSRHRTYTHSPHLGPKAANLALQTLHPPFSSRRASASSASRQAEVPRGCLAFKPWGQVGQVGGLLGQAVPAVGWSFRVSTI